MPKLAEFLQTSNLNTKDLTFIGVGIGPGSYTGIRVGVSVAQSLSYSWKIPIVGVSSLDGFIPSQKDVIFAAMIDARIGGAYTRKGILTSEGVNYLSEPAIYPLSDIGFFLQDVKILVTPSSQSLKLKLDQQYSHQAWEWEEKAPSCDALATRVKMAYQQGLWKNKGHLDLLYLRETEAEREKKKQI
jgi:tRNA threonylcarbamoyl adenosine modification protein YeaZ